MFGFVLAFPVLLYWSYSRDKRKLLQDAEESQDVRLKRTRKSNLNRSLKYSTLHGIVSETYKPEQPFALSIYYILIRRCLFVVLAQVMYAMNVPIRPLILSIVIGLLTIQHFYQKPFVLKSLNSLEAYMLVNAWLLSLFVDMDSNEEWKSIFTNVLVSLFIAPFVPIVFTQVFLLLLKSV